MDEKRGIVQVTTTDERWYVRESTDDKTGLPSYQYVPSVTWICGHYPKGVAFYKWLAEKGWDESQAIKNAAGGKGSKVHKAIELLLGGLTIRMDDKITNRDGVEEVLTVEEYDAILSFTRWYQEVKPEEIISTEVTIWNDTEGYAGTVDLIAKINGETYIIDFKTSQQVWAEYELQLSAYKHALDGLEDAKLAILQVGYRRNKNGYKFTEIDDKYDLFLAAKKIWANETSGEKPLQKDYPMSVVLTDRKAENHEKQ